MAPLPLLAGALWLGARAYPCVVWEPHCEFTRWGLHDPLFYLLSLSCRCTRSAFTLNHTYTVYTSLLSPHPARRKASPVHRKRPEKKPSRTTWNAARAHHTAFSPRPPLATKYSEVRKMATLTAYDWARKPSCSCWWPAVAFSFSVSKAVFLP